MASLDDKMVGVILAAGKGARMYPFSERSPKPILPILNRPLLAHQIEVMRDCGISEVHIVVGHLGYQKLKGGAQVTEINGTSPVDSITDWKLGVTYDLSGWLLGASYIGTNRDLTGGTAALSNKNISNGTVVVSVSKTF